MSRLSRRKGGFFHSGVCNFGRACEASGASCRQCLHNTPFHDENRHWGRFRNVQQLLHILQQLPQNPLCALRIYPMWFGL